MNDDVKQLSLEEAATHLLEECRMVLPGIQALFGFQLVAVFSNRFDHTLTAAEQTMHLAAIACIVVAVALVMAPAALHRLCEPRTVSRRFLTIASRMLMWSMAPLALGTAIDVYLVSRVIVHSRLAASIIGAAALLVFLVLWVIVPARVGSRHSNRSASRRS
jgi:uncharacterized protein DUF6328